MPDHSSIQQLLTDATALYHSGEYHQAIQAWQQVLSAEPNNQRAKEGIRMASLLLDEAQAAADASHAGSGPSTADSESPASIAKVREGIQKVREYLSSSKHLEAMEVCQSLLALAPRSAAVHEIVEEAREAYEAQPFINEHLEIARQLFVQERLDEASAELHKVFFLNSNHGEARKLEAKILALRQKRVPGSVPTVSQEAARSEPSSPAPPPAPVSSSQAAETQRLAMPPDFGDSIDLPQQPEEGGGPATPRREASPAAQGGPKVDPAQGADWESELAHLDLDARPAPTASPVKPAPAKPPEETGERLAVMDLSENPSQGPAPVEIPEPKAGHAASEPAPSRPRSEADLDLSSLIEEDSEPTARRPESLHSAPDEEPPRKSVTSRPSHAAARPGSGGSAMRYLLPLAGILIGGGVAFWYFGMQPPSSANGGGPAQPPPSPAPQRAGPAGRPAGGRGASLGLSSSGSRTSAGTASAGVQVPGVESAPPPAPAPLSPEQARRDAARFTEEGRSLMHQGKYQDAVKSFSRAMDLDPANMETKDQMDQAAAKVLEQKKLEEDLQTAKEFFVEKDYESALRKFYRLPRDRNLGELDLFIRNAWFNWAVVSMKGGNCVDALQRLKEVLTVDPGDQEAVKQQEVAEHYKDRPKDRVFYAFVDRLTFRTLNQR